MRRKLRFGSTSLVVCLALCGAAARSESRQGFHLERAGFAIEVSERVLVDRIASVFVLPGQRVPIAVGAESTADHFQVSAASGVVRQERPDRWSWTAPTAPGLYPLSVVGPRGPRMTVNAFVMVPFDNLRRGALNGYAIGRYPHQPPIDEPFYRRPAGFIEVTRENQETLLSPHFRLKQFVCKQGSRYPKYLVLRAELIDKLELLLTVLNERGIEATTLHVMSGYRTPLYNRALGNVAFSAHLWGGAADVFVDEDGDGMMDDLDGNGVVDARDTRVLSKIVEEIDRSDDDVRLVGGLGHYRANHVRGPFVHVDVRGYRVRWGG
jgi:Peptidase M15